MKKLSFLSLTVSLLCFSASIGSVLAAPMPPKLLLSWRAKSFTAAGYAGRPLPVRGTNLEAAVEVIDQEKIADTTKKEIRWYLNNDFLDSGTGLKTIKFKMPRFASGEQVLRVGILGYKNQVLEESATLPLAQPEIVIATPYQNKKIAPGANSFKALTYFFNISSVHDLLFSWSANSVKAVANTGKEDRLDLDAPAVRNYAVNITVNAENKTNDLERAGATAYLEIK